MCERNVVDDEKNPAHGNQLVLAGGELQAGLLAHHLARHVALSIATGGVRDLREFGTEPREHHFSFLKSG